MTLCVCVNVHMHEVSKELNMYAQVLTKDESDWMSRWKSLWCGKRRVVEEAVTSLHINEDDAMHGFVVNGEEYYAITGVIVNG